MLKTYRSRAEWDKHIQQPYNTERRSCAFAMTGAARRCPAFAYRIQGP